MHYQHSQFAAVIVYGMLIPFVAILLLPVFLPGFSEILLPALAVLFVGVALFYTLNVEIDAGVLICSFGIGLIRRRILLSNVQQVGAVTNPWFVGWGIRWMPGQYWLWNASGLRAVELLFKDGSRFRIGTDEPEVLAKAIQSNLRSAT